MADMKTTIIKSMEKGQETLNEIKELRARGVDYTSAPQETVKTIEKIHKNLTLKVSEAYMNTAISRTIRLTSVDGSPLPSFESGQYLNVFVTIDGVRTSRPYSISSPSTCRDYYEITVAKIPSNGFVSNYFVDELKVGDIVEANGPAGTFHYHPVFHSKNVVFVAGGSGITPFVSMSKEMLSLGLDRNIHLIYGVANSDNIIFKKDLEELDAKYDNFTYDLVYSAPEEGWTGHKGFVTKELLQELVKTFDDKTFYLCGPQVMNLSVEKSLTELGVRPAMIRREMFSQNQGIHLLPGWPEGLDPETTFKITVHSAQGIQEIEGKAGESLLITLERNKIRMNVCCRSGECSLCRVQLVSGDVYLVRGSLQRRADEKFGYVHSCKAYPISDVEILI